MMRQFSFEKLEVWKNAINLTIDIYRLTNAFPKSEMYILTTQLRRASVSISSNIAEGNYRKTGKDKSHFITMAYSSLMEVLNQLIIAKELRYIEQDELENLRDKISLVANQLNKLKNYHNK